MIGELISGVEALTASLRRGKAINVNDTPSKNQAIALASRYFKDARPLLVRVFGETDEILGHDQLWQQIVRLAHGNNARRTYLKILGTLRKQLSEFSIASVAYPETDPSNVEKNPSSEELQILRTLEAIVPSAAAAYRQGLTDLNGPSRFSYRGTATEFRESLREALYHLAPDKEVMKQDWYKSDEGQKKPTMKQRARYILLLRERNRTQMTSTEKTIGLVEELSGEVTRAIYDRASVATHVQQSKEEVQRVKRYVDTIFFDLLEIKT